MSLVLKLPDNYLSRAHQEQGCRAVERAVRSGEKSVSFSMPTGTGKTRALVALPGRCGFRRVIYVLPNLNLLDQFRRDYIEKLGWNKKKGVFYVCSEPGTEAIDDTDEADFRRSYPAASEAELRKIYARKQVIIVTTYASLPKVLRDLPATSPVDALFLDEAHHEEGPVVLEALEACAAKYMHKISASATLLPSHKPCYTYSLSAAIHDNIIKDYELFICLISTLSTAQSKIKFIKDIAAKTGNTHLIVYVTFSEADRDGATSVRKVVAELSGDPTVWVKGLTGAHSREERQAIVGDFSAPLKGAEKVKLLVNCRVLGEGADINAANGIVFDKTTTDATQLQQNIGRALRKPDGVTVKAAAILFMIQIDAEELAAVPPGAERNAALVEKVYDSGLGKFAMVAIAALLKQDPAKLRELMAGNQRFAFTRARPDLAVVETNKETVLHTQPDEDNDSGNMNGLGDAIAMGTDWPAAEVENILRDLAEGSEGDSCYDEGSSEGGSCDDEGSSEDSSESSSEEPEPFVQRLSDRLGCDVVIHHADSTMVVSQPVWAYDKTLELLKTPMGFDLVVPAADKDNERYAAATAKTHKKGRPVNFMLEQELKELVSLRLSDDTDLVHGLTARLEVSVNAEAGADTKLPLFFKAVEMNSANALKKKARVDEEGQLVASGGWPIGKWFSTKKTQLKTPSKKTALYDMLTQNGTNEIVKAKLDKFLAKHKQDQWYKFKSFSDDDKLALFLKAVEINGAKALLQKAQVNEEGRFGADEWPIGTWFQIQKMYMKKKPLRKTAIYDMLTQNGTNEIVKAHLDKFLAYQHQTKDWFRALSDDDKLAQFFKAVEINGAEALAQRAQVNPEGQLVASGGWPIGAWFAQKKQKFKNPAKKDAVFAMLTQNGTNEIVKARLDNAGLDIFLEKLSLFHKAVEVNGAKALAQRAHVDKKGLLVLEGWPIGVWLNSQKVEMKNPAKKDTLYASLTQNGTNKIVSAHLDKFLARQEKKKRKVSDVADDEVDAAPAEPPKKRQKKTAASAQPATAEPAPASRKRPAAEPEEEQQPKPKRARKQPKEPPTYNELSEADKKEIIERHLRQQQQKPAAGYRTTNPEAKDTINGVLARFVPAVSEEAGGGKVIFLDHTEFKTAYALLATGRVRPEDMLIPQSDPVVFAEMACHELFGGFVVQGDFNSVLETFLAEGGVVRSVYADYCSTLQADGLPFVALLAQHRDKLVPEAVVGLTVTRRNPEGVCYAGQDIVKMNTALLRLLKREPENLFHTAQMTWADGQPLGDGDPFTYGAGQPMVTWLIR